MCDACVICLEVIGDNNFAITSCGHKFHTSCLIANTAHNPGKYCCPLCRENLLSEEQCETLENSTADMSDDEDLDFIPENLNLPFNFYGDEEMLIDDEGEEHYEEQSVEEISNVFNVTYGIILSPHLTEDQLDFARMHYVYFMKSFMDLEHGQEIPMIPNDMLEKYRSILFKSDEITEIKPMDITEDIKCITPRTGDFSYKDGIVTAIVVNRETAMSSCSESKIN